MARLRRSARGARRLVLAGLALSLLGAGALALQASDATSDELGAGADDELGPLADADDELGPLADAGDELGLTARMRARVLAHRLPERLEPDPTNRVAELERAAELGRELFFDARLSGDGRFSCASCHDPARAFSDGRALAQGRGLTTRSSPPLEYAALQRWLFWDGRADSLWAQAAQPLESPLEMDGDRVALARLLASDAWYRAEFEGLFGALPAVEGWPAGGAKPVAEAGDARAQAWSALDEQAREAATRVLADAGKALAAYLRRLPSGSSAFDRFARALAQREQAATDEAAQATPAPDARASGLGALDAAQLRGLVLFEGRAGCWQCHSGPAFSDGEFHDLGLPVAGGGPPRDPGRREGLQRLLADPLNAAGRFSDAPRGERARELGLLVLDGESWGQFRTPSLRNVARSAPYGHAGQLATLEDVVRYYATLEGASFASHHGERVLRPLGLDAGERADLVAFLRALDDEQRDPRWLAPARAR